MGTSAAEAGFDAIVAAPGFALGVCCTSSWITGITFLPPCPAQPGTQPLAEEAARQLARYLRHPDSPFDLPLAPAGTAFQQRVWREIAAIPRGHTLFYGQLARQLESAARAVGQACGANPYPLIVPCHRVVAAGGLGGFNRQSAGFLPEVKRWLLQHEGVAHGCP